MSGCRIVGCTKPRNARPTREGLEGLCLAHSNAITWYVHERGMTLSEAFTRVQDYARDTQAAKQSNRGTR